MSEEQFGVRQAIGAPITDTRLAEQAIVCMPPRSSKFTLVEWNLNNEARCRNTEDQQQLADHILAECERVRDETKERTEIFRAASERRIEERVGDVLFNKRELEIQRQEICNELESLGVYKVRILDCLSSIQQNSLQICQKCLMLREGRVGIDLVVDAVEINLQQEITVIIGVQSLLKRVLEQVDEQMRRLRSARYLLDRDLQYKQGAIDLDKGSLNLKPTDICLSIYVGYTNLDPAQISPDEYNAYSANNIKLAAREVTSAKPIRVYVDIILKQVITDLLKVYHKCNYSFKERIRETRISKTKLEDMHKETTQKICDMQNNIALLKKALSDKEGYTGLAHTRLGRRAQRVGAELVKDASGQALYYECGMLRHSTQQLQQMLQEATASLRYLLQTQIQLEEDINVKMNNLKIDEVDCRNLSVFEASQSLFWASFGMVGLENFELAGIKSYTRFWGLLMFGSYSVINVIVLLNLLIAMMSNSYAMITEHSDVEWKFARTRLWMSYFEESATLPPPFNIFPTPKLLLKFMGARKKDKQRKEKTKEQKEKEHDVRYTAVMRAVVWRYVSAMHRKMDDEEVTEDDINELKGDVSALRYELLEVFEKNGMDVSFTDRKENPVLGKRMKVWERRLMKDFQVAPVALEDEEKKDEDGLSRFRRIAKLAVASTTNSKWDQTLAATGVSSQIGRCRSRESFKNQQNLQRAMDEARKLVLRSPLPEGSRAASPIALPVSPGHTLLELIKDFSTETEEAASAPAPKSPWKPPGDGASGSGGLLTASAARKQPPATPVKMPSKGPSKPASRSPSPLPKTDSPPVPEPSPLVSKRVPGESPPKVIKRKPQVPAAEDQAPTSPSSETPAEPKSADSKSPEPKPPVTKSPEPIPPVSKSPEPKPPASKSPEPKPLVSKSPEPKPLVSKSPEPKPAEDIAVARPVAPEIKPAEGAILPPPPAKAKAPPAPTMEVTPSTPTKAAKPPSPPKPRSRPVSPQPSTSAVPTPPPPEEPSPAKRLSSTSSTEQLIPPPSPEPLRPGKKIGEVTTIKRQPKTGWL